jgi:hypothetical protein
MLHVKQDNKLVHVAHEYWHSVQTGVFGIRVDGKYLSKHTHVLFNYK